MRWRQLFPRQGRCEPPSIPHLPALPLLCTPPHPHTHTHTHFHLPTTFPSTRLMHACMHACAQVASAIVTARNMSSLRAPASALGAGWRAVVQRALGELAPRQGPPLDLSVPPGRVRPPAGHHSKPCSGSSSGGTAEPAVEGGAASGADGVHAAGGPTALPLAQSSASPSARSRSAAPQPRQQQVGGAGGVSGDGGGDGCGGRQGQQQEWSPRRQVPDMTTFTLLQWLHYT